MNTVAKFIEWRKGSSASPEGESRTFGIIYGDPETAEPEKFRFDVCGELRQPLEENQYGVVSRTIEGGLCARLTHRGSLDTVGDVVRGLYGSVIDQGKELRDFPCFFHYKKRMPYVSEHEQETLIYLPLR